MKGLIFDPFAGISGDMTVAALLDLGLSEDWLRALVDGLALPGVTVEVRRVERQGIAARQVVFGLPQETKHRHLRHVLEIVERAAIAERARENAAAAFRALAEAEAEIHGTTPEKVHFHEVGALDSILDVVAACGGVAELGFDAFFTRPVTVGSGWIEIAHGRFPVPAPATLKLLKGVKIQEQPFSGECTTPTGAALLRVLTGGAEPPSRYTILASGYGAGSRDPEDRPNCLRLIAAEWDSSHFGARLYLIQSDLDDLPPEYVVAAQEALLGAGALDAVALQVGMKKGRPGVRIEALVPEERLEGALAALFRSSSTIGARYWPVSREGLPREEDVVEWRGQRIRRKRVRFPDGTERAKPEYDDVVRAAQALGLSAWEVRSALESVASGPRAQIPDGGSE